MSPTWPWSGDFGLGAAALDGQPAYVETDTPDDEKRMVVRLRLVALLPVLNIDDDGSVEALTDALLALRYLFGFRGTALVSSAVGAGAQRDTGGDRGLHRESAVETSGPRRRGSRRRGPKQASE
jgi:hypothetical protein